MRNNRGNISFGLMVLVFVLMLITLLITVFTVNRGVALKTPNTIEEVLALDNSVEIVKYEVINHISGKEVLFFDESTYLFTSQDTITLENTINTRLTDRGYDFSLTDLQLNDILISDYCDNLFGFNEDGVEEHLGIFCNYVPFEVEVHFTLNASSKTQASLSLNLMISQLYFYVSMEEEDKVQLDLSNHSLRVKESEG